MDDCRSRISFLSPQTRAANSPADLRAETIRRIELHLLHLLYHTRSNAGDSNDNHEPNGDENDKRDMKIACETARNEALSIPCRSALCCCDWRGDSSLKPRREELLVLRLLMGNVCNGVTATQRDVYYHLVREVPEQSTVNAAIQRLVRQLQVPRQSLGVVAGARGRVAGCLRYQGLSLLPARGRPVGYAAAGLVDKDKDDNDDEDGETGKEEGLDGGLSIPSREECLRVRPLRLSSSDAAAAADSTHAFELQRNTRFLLVVEKQAVFHRLLQEKLPLLVPCVLLTSSGFPTHAARQLLRNLHDAAPHLPVVGLVDYNPSGLAILLQYKFGSRSAGCPLPFSHAPSTAFSSTRAAAGMLENAFSCVPALSWLGLRGSHIGLRRCRAVDNGASDRVDRHRKQFVPPPAARGPGKSQRGERRSPQRPLCPLPEGLPLTPFTQRDAACMRSLLVELQPPPAEKASSSSFDNTNTHISLKMGEKSDEAGSSGKKEKSDQERSLWQAEATMMAEASVKVEIESLYTRGTLWGVGWCEEEARQDGAQLTAAGTLQAERVQPVQSQNFAQWVCQRLLKHDYI